MRHAAIGLFAALALAAFATPVSADSSEPFQVTAYGSFARMSQTGDTSGKVPLAQLQGQKGLYGVGKGATLLLPGE